MPARDLLFVDLDCFYVSVERARDPSLRGRPVVVGGDLEDRRGVVASASYEARAHGVRAGMPLAQARRALGHLPRRPTRDPAHSHSPAHHSAHSASHPRATSPVFLRGDHRAYEEASRAVRKVLEQFTPAVEPLSLDEAILDLGGCERLPYAGGARNGWMAAAEAIQNEVLRATRLPCSIGIGPSRPVARIACALAKPHGIFEVRPDEAPALLEGLPLRFLPGVGPRMRESLERFQLDTIGDLARIPEDVLAQTFGKRGVTASRRARGLDADLDEARVGERTPKHPTISRETSFARDTADPDVIGGMVSYLAQRAVHALRSQGRTARSVGVKIRYSDFATREARLRLSAPTDRVDPVLTRVDRLWRRLWDRRVKLRLVGVSLHGIEVVHERQLALFDEHTGVVFAEAPSKTTTHETDAHDVRNPALGDAHRTLDTIVEAIRSRHGFGALVQGQASTLIQRSERDRDGFRLATPACSR